MLKYDLHNFKISIKEKNFFSKLFDEEFNEFRSDFKDGKEDLLITFKKISFKSKYKSGLFDFFDNSFKYSTKHYSFILNNLFSKNKSKLILNLNKISLFSKLILFTKSFLLSGSLNYRKNIYHQIMGFECFWSILAIKLSYHDLIFLHGGSLFLDSKNKGVVLAGTGGCGKTSTTFEFLLDPKNYYFSEDFTIISKNNLLLSPKRVTVYSSDIMYGNSIFKKSLKNLNLLNKFSWYFTKTFLFFNSRRKLPLFDFFDNLKIKKKLDSIYYLQKTNNSNLSISEISNSELSTRVLNSSFRELKLINELLLVSESVLPNNKFFLTLTELRKILFKKYYDIFKDKQIFLINVPFKISPNKIRNLILKNEIN